MFYVTLDCAGLKEVDDSRKTVLPKCSSNLDHVLLRRWTREAGTLILSSRPSLGSAPLLRFVQEKRSQEVRPTDEMVIIRILLRLSDDYDQIQHSSLDVEGDIVTLRLEFFPWKVVEAVRRVEEARRKGFFRLGDLWRLERHGILDKTVVESAGFSANLLKQPRKGSSADTVAFDL